MNLKSELNRLAGTAQKVVVMEHPTLQQLSQEAVVRQAKKITADPSHILTTHYTLNMSYSHRVDVIGSQLNSSADIKTYSSLFQWISSSEAIRRGGMPRGRGGMYLAIVLCACVLCLSMYVLYYMYSYVAALFQDKPTGRRRDRAKMKDRLLWSREKMSVGDDRLIGYKWTKERHEYFYTS